MNTRAITHASFPGLLVVVILFATAVTSIAATEKRIPYGPEFIQLVQQGRIRSAELITGPSGITYIRATLVRAEGKEEETLRVDDIPNDIPSDQVINMLIEKGVAVTHMGGSLSPFSMFTMWLPQIVGFVVWIVVVIIALWLGFRLVRAVERIAENTKK
jgi:hypothetical protein